MKRFSYRMVPVLLLMLVLLSSGGCTKKSRVRWDLRSASRDFAAENYDDAEVEYKKVLRLDRFNATAIGQLGRIYVKEGRLVDARIYLTKAVELMPNSIPFQLAFGQVNASLHEFTNSANIAMRILSSQPTNEEALVLLIDSYGQSAEVQQKVAILPHIKENPAYHMAMAVLALRQQQTELADSEINQALAADPKSSQAYFVLAEIRAREKSEQAAVEALRKAADLAPLRSNLRIKYVEFLLRNNNAAEARKVLAPITVKAPDYIPAWTTLMNLSMAEKKYDEAAKYADTIVERDELNYEGLLGRGAARLAKGDADGAVIQFEHMNAVYKKSPQARYELATAYLAAHNRPKCVENLNQALAIAPEYPQANMLLGQVLIENGDPGAAVQVLTRYLKKVPNTTAEAELLLADAYVILNKPDAALAIYANLSKALPNYSKIPFLMGIVLAQQHRSTAAHDAFEKALELEPSFIQAADRLITLDIEQQRNFREAETVAQAQIDRAPKSAVPWELLAKVDMAQTNLARAETNLVKAIELEPDLPNPYILLAQVYSTAGKYPEALQKLNAAATHTNDASIYLQIGNLDDQIKNYDAARDAYEKVLTINSNNIAALNNLSYIYSERLNKLDQAYELAQRARNLLPYNPNVADTLGWILFHKGEYTHALTVMQDAGEKAPGDPEIQYHLGMSYYMLDQEAQARAALQRAVASSQDFPAKDDARQRLAILDMNPAVTGPTAVTKLERALKDHPDDPVVLNRMALQYEKAGDWDKATATYETILKPHPDAVPIMARLAWLYTFQTHNPDRALALAKDAHRLALDNAEASAVLGHWLYRAHDYSRALSVLESAVEGMPNQPEILQDLAWAYYSVGRVAEAQTTMQKALQSASGQALKDDAKRFLALQDDIASASKAQAAAGQAQQILQADPGYVPALMVSGVAQEHAGTFKAAQEAYAKVLDIFPAFAPAQRLLAILDARHFPDDVRGFASAEKAHAAYQDDPEVVRSLGILSFYQAKYPRSAELLEQSAANNKDDGEVCYYLGMDYYQLKRSKESRQSLERALSLRIPENMAADAKKTLATLK